MAEAAAAAATLARQLSSVQSTADKQLSSLYLSIKPLKESNYHTFVKQLKRQSLAYKWPPHILADAGGAVDLTDGERAALDENTVEGLTTLLNIRNAYVIITAMCDGHQVEHSRDSFITNTHM